MFKKWILNGTKIDALGKLARNHPSSKTLRRRFHAFLKNKPKPFPVKDSDSPKRIYIKVDGKYFGRWGCLLLYKAGKDLIYWSFVRRENFASYVSDLIEIQKLGYEIIGVTSDWHGSLVAAVDYLFKGTVPHQRCLVHTQRRCEILLTQNPKTRAGKDLQDIVIFLNQLPNHYEVTLWKKRLSFWERDYGHLTKERTYSRKEDGSRTWWYTHKNLRSAFRTLKGTLTHLFLYLDYEGLDKDTNGLEAEFSHLKQKINMHRGLARERKISALFWYCYFKAEERKDKKTMIL